MGRNDNSHGRNRPSRRRFLADTARVAAGAAAVMSGADLVGNALKHAAADSNIVMSNPAVANPSLGWALQQDHIGLNATGLTDSQDMPHGWATPQLALVLRTLAPSTLRTGGTTGNYFNPTTGGYYSTPNRKSIAPWLTDPITPLDQIAEAFVAQFNQSIPTPNNPTPSPVIMLNMLTSTGPDGTPSISSQEAMLDAIAANLPAGVGVRYLEYGNEFYLPNPDYTALYPTGTDYGTAVNTWRSQITSYQSGKYRNTQAGVVGRVTPFYWIAPSGSGIPPSLGPATWTQDTLSKLSPPPTAVTYHIYPALDCPLLQTASGPNDYPNPLLPESPVIQDVMNILSVAILSVNQFIANDVAYISSLPSPPDIWITEFNVGGITVQPTVLNPGPPPTYAFPSVPVVDLQGRWTHALFVAIQVVLLSQIKQVTRLICHGTVETVGPAAAFINTTSFLNLKNYPSAVQSTVTQPFQLTAAGRALALLFAAMSGATYTSTLSFSTTPQDGTSYPAPFNSALYQFTFSTLIGSYFRVGSGSSAADHYIVINLGSATQTITFDAASIHIPLSYVQLNATTATDPTQLILQQGDLVQTTGSVPTSSTVVPLPPFSMTHFYPSS